MYDHHFQLAIQGYSEAIKLDSNNPIYYSNRALAYIRTEAYGFALNDASKAIELDPTFIKAYYRRGAAKMALRKFKESLSDFKLVFTKCPSDKDAKYQFESCQKIVRRMQFEDAIAVHDDEIKETVVAKGYEDIRVEPGYVKDGGPCLQSGESLSLEFVKKIISWLKGTNLLHVRFARQIIETVSGIFKQEASLVDISVPENGTVTVCGDVHGQFYDLLTIFEKNGFPSEQNVYLFNGDFVDRGSFSVEVILTLFALKCALPGHFFLARGNHETDSMNQLYGFKGEVEAKYDSKLFHLFSETFNTIPIAHVIGSKVFVVHGGLSKDVFTLDQVRKINRFCQPSDTGLYCDLLWSDPRIENGAGPSKRGVALQFGPDITAAFLKTNNLNLLVRSHEVKDEGYEIMHNNKCITIFSAPNYCDSMGNKGAFMRFTPNLEFEIIQFAAAPHPPVMAMQYSPLRSMGGF